jgi:enamine deaminase RidA (YjgF/YER057c/UK114 family)
LRRTAVREVKMSRKIVPASPSFSQAVRDGLFVFVSGQVAVDEAGQLVGEGDCGAQTEQCFRNLERVLGQLGAGLADIVKLTCFLIDRGDYPAFAAVKAQRFATNPPASTGVIVAGLLIPGLLVEIEAIAVVPG